MFQVALDVLPVQASAVPCERVFSSSKETCTDRRNRILPKLLKVLQIIKYGRRQDRLDFMDGILANEEDYTIDGNLTARAVEELIQLGRIDEIKQLLESAELEELTCVTCTGYGKTPDWLSECTCMQSGNSVQLASATRQNSIKRVGASYQLELDSADSVATLRISH